MLLVLFLFVVDMVVRRVNFQLFGRGEVVARGFHCVPVVLSVRGASVLLVVVGLLGCECLRFTKSLSMSSRLVLQ